jgi:hypothetical protein
MEAKTFNDLSDARRFMLAGNAIFTIDNGKGEHFTFRMSQPEGALNRLDSYFLSVLTGPDNNRDYTYMGIFDAHWCNLIATKGSKITTEAKSWKVAAWLMKVIWSGRNLPDGYVIRHEGRCGRCGRRLTVVQSIDRGIGPECEKLMGS